MRPRFFESLIGLALVLAAGTGIAATASALESIPLPRVRPDAAAAPVPPEKPVEAGIPLPRERPRLAAAEPEAASPRPPEKPAPAEASEPTPGTVPVPAAKPQTATPREKPAAPAAPQAPPPVATPSDRPAEPDAQDEARVPGPPEKPPVRLGPPQGAPFFAADAMSPACAPIEEGRVSGRPLKPVEDLSGCLVPALYAVSSVGSERAVALSPEAELNCAMVDRLDTFVEEVMEPAAKDILKSDLVGLGIAGSYVCRPRNGQVGAKQSEHGFANAVDVARFVLADGRAISVAESWKDEGDAGRFLRAVHEKACGPFTTVLGPDSDEYHTDHFHLDLQPRGKDGRTTFCQ